MLKLLPAPLGTILFTFAVLAGIQSASAQFVPASPPVADFRDTRFQGVKEDWNSPSLATSNLRPAQPIVGYVNEYSTYTVELLRLQWRWGDPIDAYVIRPRGITKPPVILYLYDYVSDTDRFKDESFQKTVTKDGFAAVGFVSALSGQRYHDRPMREWFVSELQESLAESAHDLQLLIDYLSTRNDLDMCRLGMYAQGSGASIAILASAVDPRIKVLDTIDPWGDWSTWMAKSPVIPEEERDQYTKPEFLSRVAALDPVVWLPKIQAQNFRLQDALFDLRTPSPAKEKLRAAVRKSSTITIYKTADDFNAVVRNKKELEWIERGLRSLADAPLIPNKALSASKEN